MSNTSLSTPGPATASSPTVMTRAASNPGGKSGKVRSQVFRAVLAVLLPLAVLALWQLSGNNGAVAGGALPTPDRVWRAWKIWAFDTPGPMTLSPYVGTWGGSVYFSAQRVAKGFGLAQSRSACRSAS